MSPLMEIREATEDEQEILDDRKAVRSGKPRKVREAPMRDLSDKVAEYLLRGQTVTLIYKGHPDRTFHEPVDNAAYFEAKNAFQTLKGYLNQKGMSISATLEFNEQDEQTELIFSMRS